MQNLINVLDNIRLFELEAHNILAVHETSKSRIILLDETYNKLGKLSIEQNELFRQALRCIENNLFRAAHVMAWAGFMDFIEEKINEYGCLRLSSVRPRWNYKTIEELRENQTEYAIIEVFHDISLCSKNEKKAFHGLLNKRNECAHPSDYFPDLNQTLGYISELINRIDTIKKKERFDKKPVNVP